MDYFNIFSIQTFDIDTKSMILAGNGYAITFKIFDRMISPMMTKF